MQTQNIKIARVIPLLRLPRGLDFFDYTVPDTIPALVSGTLVRIPFRSKNVRGVVVDIRTVRQKARRLKPLIAVVTDERLLAPHTLRFAKELQKETLAPLSLLFHVFLPHIPTRAPQTPHTPLLPPLGIHFSTLRIKKKSLPTIKKALETSRPTIFHWHRNDERVITYVKLIERHLPKGDVLLLFANQEQIAFFLSYLPAKYKNDIALITSAIDPTTLFTTWCAIAQKKKRLVIGTRRALFAPFQNLQCIILDGEELYGWKEEQNPRYDARIAARLLARISGARLVLGSPSPTVESSQKYTLSTPPPHPSPFQLVDLHDLFQDKNFSYISSQLQDALSALPNNTDAVLFLNRRGFGTVVFCDDCEKTLLCSACALPLTHHKDRGGDVLRCHHCLHTEPFLLSCPHCHGTHLRSLGKGVERIEEEIQKLFGKTKNIHVLTYPALDRLLWERRTPSFLAVIDALTPLHVPDFRVLEHLWHFLLKLTTFASAKNIPTIIQSFVPEHPIFTALRKGDPTVFVEQELRERKTMGYPPFQRLIKILFKGKTSDEARKKAEALSTLLKNSRCSSPYPAHPPRQHGKYVWNLLLRVDPSTSLKQLLKNFPNDVLIDVDPESTL